LDIAILDLFGICNFGFVICMALFSIINVAHAGVISDAPTIPSLLLNILTFLLQVFGILGIISLVVSGMYYFLAAGDAEQVKKAKMAVGYSVMGIVVGLGGMVVVRTIAGVL